MNFLNPQDIAERADWRAARARMEQSGLCRSIQGHVRPPHRTPLYRFVGLFDLGRFPGPFRRLHNHMVDRARNIHLVDHQIAFSGLSSAFDGYRILHLSDLHLDRLPGLEDSISMLLAGEAIDALVITGDFVDSFSLASGALRQPLAKALSTVKARDGIFAVLGNHDSWRHVNGLEALGIRVLINESVRVRRGDAILNLTGIDDPSHFYTPDAVRAIESSGDGFKILLAHSPELANIAARSGYALYLAGHTHGGQICLPSGRPIYHPLRRFRKFHGGLWSHDGMAGHTSVGAGTSCLPYRAFKRGEISSLTLRCTPMLSMRK